MFVSWEVRGKWSGYLCGKVSQSPGLARDGDHRAQPKDQRAKANT